MLNKIRIHNLTAAGIFAVIAGLAISSGCAKPPTKEMADAEAAVSAAKAAEADVYVPSEYKSAEDMLNQAKDEVRQKEYKIARDSAIKTKGLADSAKEHAITAKEKAKNEANGILADLKSAIDDADRAGARRFYPDDFRGLDNTLGELKSAYQSEKYLDVISKGGTAVAKARKLADMSKVAAEEEARRKAEEEARRREEEERRRAEDERRRVEEEARRKAEEARQAEEARRAAEEEEARRRAAKPETYSVVRGDCLWNVSKKDKIYDNPFMWPLIYKENRSQIRDPDLIFPKQELKVPRAYTQKQEKEAISMAKHRGPWSLHDGK